MDPYGMALKGDRQGFLRYFAQQTDEELLGYRTFNGECAIHVAAAMEDPELIKKFLGRLPVEKRLEALMQTDDNGNTAVHALATINNVDVAKTLVEFSKQSNDADKNPLVVENKLGETPLYRAASVGKIEALRYFAEQVGDSNLRHHFRRHDNIPILHIAVLSHHVDTAIWILNHDSSLANESTSKGIDGFTCLELLALMPSVFSTERTTIWTSLVYSCLPTYLDDDNVDPDYKEDFETGKIDNHIGHTKKRRGCPAIKKIWEKKQIHKKAVALVKMLVEKRIDDCATHEKPTPGVTEISLGLGKGNIEKKVVDVSAGEWVELMIQVKKGCTNKAHVDQYPQAVDQENDTTKDMTSSMRTMRILLFAVSNGIIEILEEIRHKYPQTLDNVNEKGQNILHVAIMYRQLEIFEIIKEKMQLSLAEWALKIDNEGYTILHQVADMKYYKQGTQAGPVLQFQDELEWFERVKDIAPPHYAMHRDKNKRMTANDLFDLTHEDQLRKAQDWIKETSQSCSTLAILIATVVFTAAFTVPGGTNDKGFPHFLESPLFYVFTVMDVVSLALSLSSVVMFLSILTSSFDSSDFLSVLPSKLTIGFTLLFFSVLTSMITFSASILLIIRLEKKWTATLYAAAFFPVIVLALMQFPFYAAFVANLKVYYLEFIGIFPRKKKRKTHWD
ncbi:hypothetical protein WN943_001990 [Citrus x changshan-huyou]